MDGANDALGKIEKLAALRDAGVLSDAEFAEAKARALADPAAGAHPQEELHAAPAEAYAPEPRHWDAEPQRTLPPALMALFALLLVGGLGGTGYLAVAGTTGLDAATAPAEDTSFAADADTYEDLGEIADDAPAISDVAEELPDAYSAPESYTATLTCRFAGQSAPVSLCLYGSGSSDVHGELKVTQSGAVKQYSGIELAQLSSYSQQFDLGGDFEFATQAGGDQDAVLRLEVSNTNGPVYEDETSGFGTINVSSWQIQNSQ